MERCQAGLDVRSHRTTVLNRVTSSTSRHVAVGGPPARKPPAAAPENAHDEGEVPSNR